MQHPVDIARLRVASHRLSDTSFGSPAEVVAWMGAMQAQDFNMVKWAVGVRSPGCGEAAVQEAFDRGDILRTHVLRPTWHLVPAANIRWMLELTAPRIRASMRARDRELGLDQATIVRSNEVMIRALEGGHAMTREEIGMALKGAGIAIDAARLYHIAMRAEIDGVVCSGPVRGGKQTCALLAERAPKARTLPREEALERLARSYFTSHAPASTVDFAWWSGLTMGDARAGAEALRGDFVVEKIEGLQYLIPQNLRAGGDGSGLWLLPAFDEYIVAYRDRRAVLCASHHARAVSSNGIFRPVIVENGVATGLWRKTTSRKNPVAVDFFAGQPDVSTSDTLERAVSRFKMFHGIQ
ncbi:hypothetical protein FACS1894159_01470 [Bacteroidia bacterium]|nr:hypothetical protein FACS1894159_01470 [Bacteroidia bacterium]